jgi:hypothetical protein
LELLGYIIFPEFDRAGICGLFGTLAFWRSPFRANVFFFVDGGFDLGIFGLRAIFPLCWTRSHA